jgi:hypothetical protein
MNDETSDEWLARRQAETVAEGRRMLLKAAPIAVASLAVLAKSTNAKTRARAIKKLHQVANSNHPMAALARKHLASIQDPPAR